MTSSLISFARRDIELHIPGLYVSDYKLPATKDGIVLHVEDTFYYKPDNEGNQDRVAVSSKEIVLSLVHMHLTAQLCYADGQYPALFAIPEVEVDLKMVQEKYKAEKDKALAAQKKWFIALVKIADDDWQVAHKHMMISDIQRTAARELGIKREWLMAVEDENSQTCPFCSSMLINPSAPICPTCGRVHNPTKMKELELRLGTSKTVQ